MEEERRTNGRPQITITAGAWIGIVSIALTIVLSLFGAAGWIITRMDTRIDRLDTRIDTLAVEIATMRGQLDFLARTQLGEQAGAATETTPGQ